MWRRARVHPYSLQSRAAALQEWTEERDQQAQGSREGHQAIVQADQTEEKKANEGRKITRLENSKSNDLIDVDKYIDNLIQGGVAFWTTSYDITIYKP